MSTDPRGSEATVRRNEDGVLRRFGARWAVLVAWQTDLSRRSSASTRELARELAAARNKISSGCFSACEVGCDLERVEAALTSMDASLGDEQVDKWLALLGRAMDESGDVEELLQLPAIKIHASGCRAQGCNCGG
jgi:hypothetical protein